MQRFPLLRNAVLCLLTGMAVEAQAHIQPVLHQLPDEYWLKFKVMVLTFKAICSQGLRTYRIVSPHMFH